MHTPLAFRRARRARTTRWCQLLVLFFAAATASVAARPLVVMPLGDSITRGTGGTQAGYRDPLYRRLSAAGYEIRFVGGETTTPTTFLTQSDNHHHEGHGGYAIPQISSGLDGAETGWLTGLPGVREPVFPDVILLMAGTNDIGTGGQTGAVALARMDALLAKLAVLRPSARVIVATLVPYFGTHETREQRQLDFNAGLPALVDKYLALGRRVWLCDMRPRVSSAARITNDGVHPNQEGYNAIAEGWFETFQTLPLIENWRHAKFGSAAAGGVAADLADPDADGFCNLLEYALNGDPRRGGDTGLLPRASFVTEDAGEFLALTFLRRRDADIDYRLETSSDLLDWTSDSTPIGTPLVLSDFFEQVTVRDRVALAASARRFARLRILAR